MRTSYQFFTLFFFLVFLIGSKSLGRAAILSQPVDTTSSHQSFQMADSLAKVGNYQESIKEFEKASVVFEEASQWKRVAQCHIALSRNYLKLGQTDQSLELADKVLNEYAPRFSPNEVIMGAAYERSGSAYAYKGQYDLAFDQYQLALTELAKRDTIHSLAGSVYSNIAFVYFVRGDLEECINQMHKALENNLRTVGEKDIQTAYAYNNIGGVYVRKDDHKNALKYFEKSVDIKIQIKGENHPDLINSYANMASAYVTLGRPGLALNYHNKALKLALNSLGKKHPNTGGIHIQLAETFLSSTQPDSSLNHLKKASAILEQVDARSETIIRLNGYTALTYNALEDYEQALIYAKKTLALAESLTSDAQNLPDAYNILARTYLLLDEFELSARFAQKAVDAWSALYGKKGSSLSQSLHNLAEAYIGMHQFDEALLVINDAISANSLTDPNDSIGSVFIERECLDPARMLDSYSIKSDYLIESYLLSPDPAALEQVEEWCLQGDAFIDKMRLSNVYTYGDKIAVSRRAVNFYELAVQGSYLNYEVNGNIESLKRALYFSEKEKNSLLKEAAFSPWVDKLSGIPDSLLNKQQALSVDMAYYESELQKAKLGQKILDSTSRSDLEDRLFKSAREQKDLTEKIKIDHPDYYTLKLSNRMASIEEMQELLDVNSTLIEYYVGDTALYTFVLTKEGLFANKLVKDEAFEEKVQALNQSIIDENFEKYTKNARDLYQDLIEPVKDKIKGNHLIIVPDGSLWNVNFDLLLTQDSDQINYRSQAYLLRDYAISYAYSMDLMVRESNRSIPTDVKKEMLAFSFGSSDIVDSGNRIDFRTLRSAAEELPGSVQEIKAISSMVDGEYFYGKYADETNFKAHAKDYSMLHLAVHGEVDDRYPMNSQLRFMDDTDSEEDGALHAYELYNMSLNADLAVLSACNTGAGQLVKGEGIMSMGQAFTYAGCRSLVLTQWAISDVTSPQLMKDFYRGLKEGLSKDVALQQAKLNHLANANASLTSPFYWASFVLLGNNKSVDLEDIPYFFYLLTGVLALIIGVVILRRK